MIALLGAAYGQAPQTGQGSGGPPKGVERIVVTATKREEDAQDVAVAVQALGERALDQQNINTFDDYLLTLPGVTSGGNGPGQATIYIRGLASTTPNNNVATSSGIAPNVALYLDEQPVTQVGRNLDVYAADLNRVEVLSGPQGTLFGASAQSGAVRLITNKPDLDDWSGAVEGAITSTASGELSEKIEAVFNVPLIEGKLALRGVFYNDNQGGYIDNVFGETDAGRSARFAPGGLQAGADLSNVELLNLTNEAFIEDDFNDAVYTGGRVSVTYVPIPELELLAVHSRQKLDADGVFAVDPTLDDDEVLSVQRFAPDRLEDSWHDTAWTADLRLEMLQLVYTGAYLERNVDQTADYTDYLFAGQYIPYYVCDGAVSYPGAGGPAGTCQPPQLFNDLEVDSRTWTHEARFNTPDRFFIRATGGVFYSDQEVTERGDFTYVGSQFVEGFAQGEDDIGFAPNFPLPGSSVSDPSARFAPVIFFNDITRTDEQIGVFGEVTVDVIPDLLSLTGGLRWYDVEVDLVGSANSSFFNLGADEDAQAFGSNLDLLFNGVQDPGEPLENGEPLPDVAKTRGVIFKANAALRPTDQALVYFTFSQGFRPGLLNRPGGQGDEEAGFIPGAVDTDEVNNYEIGWKTNLFANQVQFNGSAFWVTIAGLQTSVFNPATGSNLNFAANAADARIRGVEGDFVLAPAFAPGLTATAAFSVLDTEITDILDVAGSSIAPVGSELSFAPTFQGNMRVRYERPLPFSRLGAGWFGHAQTSVSYSGSSFSDIIVEPERRVEQDNYTIWNLFAGVSNATYSAELFVENVLDTRAETFNAATYRNPGNSPNYVRSFINRPRTWGLRVAARF